jgi:hypothetical protein
MAEPVDDELLLKLAKNLQASYSKQTSADGEPRKWRDVPAAERQIWTRLARNVARILAPQDSSTQ